MTRVWLAFFLILATAGCAGVDSRAQRSAIIADSVNATVQLVTEREGGGGSSGSAVVIAVESQGGEDSDGTEGRVLLLTAAHVLAKEGTPEAIFALTAATRTRVPAEVIAIDRELDVALVETRGLAVRPVRWDGTARLGDDVWVVGFPWGRERTVVRGVVSQVAQSGSDDSAPLPIEGPVRLIDASVNHGVSGGGVFDGRTGALVGLVRGYRTVQLSMPGADATPLRFPVAGETTVIPTSDISCFLTTARPATLGTGWLPVIPCGGGA